MKESMIKKIIPLILLIVVSLIFTSCSASDPLTESLYTSDVYIDGNLTVGEDNSFYDTNDGSSYFDSVVTIRSDDFGAGLMVLGHNGIGTLHSGVGTFDLTGGAYDNLFTSTIPVFEIEDEELSNWLIVTGGAYKGYVAEVETYIDASNVILYTPEGAVDLVNVDFIIITHPIFSVCDKGNIHLDAGDTGDFIIHTNDYSNGCVLLTDLDVGIDDTSAICVDVSANGYSASEAIRVDYDTGDLQPDDHASIFKVSLDDTGAVSSNSSTEIDFINLLTLDEEEVTKNAIHIGQSFDSAITVSGGLAADIGFGYEVSPDAPIDRVNGVAPDGTAFLESSASDLTIFDSDNDYILIGSSSTFEAVDAILSVGANADIAEDYYYSTGAGTWSPLIVSDTLNGFKNSGTITFLAPLDWVLSNLIQPAGAAITNAYYIKIVRTRNNLVTPPVEDYFKLFASSSTTDFEIMGDGTIRPVHMADASATNNSIYYSLTQSKLVYKDSSGVVNSLY